MMENSRPVGGQRRFPADAGLFLALLVISFVFFAWCRNNTFWHSGDFRLLEQAVEIDASWRAVFATVPDPVFQPLIHLIFYVEYKLFGLDASKYYMFNILVHSINALLVYYLVFTLLRKRSIAVLSSVLFACAVGNYGKAVMVVSGVSDLLITMLTMLTLLFYFKNELEKGGKLSSGWFITSMACFLLSLMTKATSFSILGCMLAFNVFFRKEINKRVFHRNFLVMAAIALTTLLAKVGVLGEFPGQSDFIFIGGKFFKNFASYLVRMVFPIHHSSLVAYAGPLVRLVYQVTTEIRLLVFLCIVSYSVFGFIFGNRAIRFFITWTYITVTPFCFFRFPEDWLNIRYLYLVSVGFIMILASGTVFASGLLAHRRWKRLVPYAIPLFFVVLSQFITAQLDKNYERIAASAPIVELKSQLLAKIGDPAGSRRE